MLANRFALAIEAGRGVAAAGRSCPNRRATRIESRVLRIGVPKETAERERRVAIVPDVVRRLVAAEHEVVVEPGAGLTAGAPTRRTPPMGASLGDPWGAEVVAKVAPPSAAEVARLGSGTILVGFLNPLGDPAGLEAIAATGATALAMEKIPRISRAQSMDALSSQATVLGLPGGADRGDWRCRASSRCS